MPFHTSLTSLTDTSQPTVEALQQHHQHWRTLATLQRAKLGFLQQEKISGNNDDPFHIAANQDISVGRANQIADPYNFLYQSDYHEQSYRTENNTRYFQGEFNRSSNPLEHINEDSSAHSQNSLPTHPPLTNPDDEARKKLGSNNPLLIENPLYGNASSQENQWESLIQSSESKRDTSNSTQQHFLRAYNSIVASQHLQR